MIYVIVADDHETMRSSFSSFINNHSEMTVVGEAQNGMEALNLIEKHHPDILILDIEMPVMDGLEVARKLEDQEQGPRIIIVSNYADRFYVESLLDLGVCGYIIKEDAITYLTSAILQVHRDGEKWISPSIRHFAI